MCEVEGLSQNELRALFLEKLKVWKDKGLVAATTEEGSLVIDFCNDDGQYGCYGQVVVLENNVFSPTGASWHVNFSRFVLL